MDTNPKNEDGKEERRLISSLKKVFGTVYFVQGTSGLSSLSVFYYLKEVLKVSDSMGQIFQGLSTMAWYIKPLWGFISDRISIFGYRRKTYFVFMAFLALMSWASMGLFAYLEVDSVILFLILFNFAMTGYAFIDVVTDALMVEHGQRLKKVGSFVSFQWIMLAVSALIVGLFSGYVQEQIQITRETGQGLIDYWFIFGITGIFPLCTAYVGIRHAHEERDENQEPFSWKKIPNYAFYVFTRPFIWVFWTIPVWAVKMVCKLSGNLKPGRLGPKYKEYSEKFKVLRTSSRYLWLLILFIAFWNFSPSIGYIARAYQVDNLGFEPMHFGILQAIGGVIWLLSILTYSWFVKKYKNLNWSHYLYTMVGLGIISLVCNYYYYLPNGHWAYAAVDQFGAAVASLGIPWGTIFSPFAIIMTILVPLLVLYTVKFMTNKSNANRTKGLVTWILTMTAFFYFQCAPETWFLTGDNPWQPITSFIGYEDGMPWNRFHSWALFTGATIGFADIPAFLIPLTICGQLTSGKNAGMIYASLMALSNLTGSLGSLVGGGLYSIFTADYMTGFMASFQASALNISGAAITDERLLILQLFIYISALFTLFTVPFIKMLKNELNSKKVNIYLSEE